MFLICFVTQLMICFLELFDITNMVWYVQLIPTWIYIVYIAVWVIGIAIVLVGCVILAFKGDDFIESFANKITKKKNKK